MHPHPCIVECLEPFIWAVIFLAGLATGWYLVSFVFFLATGRRL